MTSSCDNCKGEDIILISQRIKGKFAVITESCLDWMILVPAKPDNFNFQKICHPCIEKMVFEEGTLLIDGDYLNGNYDFTKNYAPEVLSDEALTQCEKILDFDFIHFMKDKKLDQLTSEEKTYIFYVVEQLSKCKSISMKRKTCKINLLF